MSSRAQKILALIDEGTADFKRGIYVENMFLRACDFMGLQYVRNNDPDQKGRRWDFRPVGAGWSPQLVNRDINIKHAGGALKRWAFGGYSQELRSNIPWDSMPPSYDKRTAEAIVRNFIKTGQHEQTIFLKADSASIENKMIDQVLDIEKNGLTQEKLRHLRYILIPKKNWKIANLGRNYTIGINSDDAGISAITIRKEKNIFLRADRPTVGKSGGRNRLMFKIMKAGNMYFNYQVVGDPMVMENNYGTN